MNKKLWYWVIGAAAAVVVIALVWSAVSSQSTPPSPSASVPPSGNGQMDHSGMDDGSMDHGSSGQPEDPNLRDYLEAQDTIMEQMMADMAGIEHSGSAAIDFLDGMIPHHESAVAMAERYLEYGGAHEVLAPLARDIITVQTDEIQQMKDMIDALEAAGDADEDRERAYLDAYDKLMDHTMSHASADSLDAAFAEGMIMHHQMAVDMANAILPHTDAEEVTALARAIVETQEQEIAEMQAVLDGLDQP